MLSNRALSSLLILPLLMIGGCAAPYVEPTSGPTARVRILAPTVRFTESLGLLVYPGGKCDAEAVFGVLGGNLGFLHEKDLPSLDMPTILPIKRGTSFERRIPAGGKYLFRAYSSRGSDMCTAHASFVPQPDTDYEILLHSTAFKCGLDVRKIAVDSTGTAFAIKPTDVTYPKKCE